MGAGTSRTRTRAQRWLVVGCMMGCVLWALALPSCYTPFLPRPEPKGVEQPHESVFPRESFRDTDATNADASGPELPFEGAAACPSLQPARCGDQCVDLFTNPEHCGGCFQGCPTTALCQGGQCTCPAGQQACAGLCVDTSSHLYHCGACDIQCPLGQRCANGVCEFTCVNPGETMCGGQCVDLSTDQAHCGACAAACPAGKSCSQGACKDNPDCQVQTDCPNGQICTSGKCVPCQKDADCSAKQLCLRGVCRNIPCQKASECPSGLLCIGGNCAGCQKTSQCPQVPGKIYAKSLQRRLPSGARVDFLFSSLPPSSGKIDVTLILKGDYDGDSEYATLFIDGKNIGRINPNTENSYTRGLSIGASYAADGKILIRLINTDSVDDANGTVKIRYTRQDQQSCQAGRCQ